MQASSPDASSDERDSIAPTLKARLRDQSEQIGADEPPLTEGNYVNSLDRMKGGLAEPWFDQDEEGYSFWLFARPLKRKIVLWSALPVTRESGFVKAERPQIYYFTGQTYSEQASQYGRAAIFSDQLLKGPKMRWVRLVLCHYDGHSLTEYTVARLLAAMANHRTQISSLN